jgi:hypothetical protein
MYFGVSPLVPDQDRGENIMDPPKVWEMLLLVLLLLLLLCDYVVDWSVEMLFVMCYDM